MTTEKNKPIYAGRCVFNAEVIGINLARHIPSYAGVRVMQPSSGGGDEHYIPPSDVWLYLTAKDAQALSAYFGSLARKLTGVEA